MITIYSAHCDGMSHVENGPHVLVWGGAVDDRPEDGGAFIPDWWFLSGSDFEVAANPTHWLPIPKEAP
jgi:predicted transcriptional regulator